MDVLHAAVTGATEPEVGRAKAQMKVGLLSALESSAARCDQLARQVLAFGRLYDLEEIAARIDAVTVVDARSAGSRLVRSSPLTLSCGPSGWPRRSKRCAKMTPNLQLTEPS